MASVIIIERSACHIWSDLIWVVLSLSCNRLFFARPINRPITEITRMHSSRMFTAHFSGCLSCIHPSLCHACPPATHVPCHPCLPPGTSPSHICPLPCMPHCHGHPITMHAPFHHAPPCHACPPGQNDWRTSENITLPQTSWAVISRSSGCYVNLSINSL